MKFVKDSAYEGYVELNEEEIAQSISLFCKLHGVSSELFNSTKPTEILFDKGSRQLRVFFQKKKE